MNNGRYGELCAAHYVRKKKWNLLASNFYCRYGEIDLIAERGGILSFIEVKTRDASSIAAPAAFVDERKQRRLITTAQVYLSRYPCALQPRFDVIEVITHNNKAVKINWIENAFEVQD